MILPDADLATAVKVGVAKAFINSGQTCNALTRMLVHADSYDEAVLVSGTGKVTGEAIAAHPGVEAVSFTGSVQAGRRVAEVAAGTVKRVTLGVIAPTTPAGSRTTSALPIRAPPKSYPASSST